MASGRVCLQWTLIVFNTLSLILGIIAISACIYELQKYDKGSAEHIEKLVQLGAASLLVLSAFIGCYGAVDGSIKVLLTFIVILIALIISHIWKLWRYDEAKQLQTTENFVSYAWYQELVTPGAMDSIQYGYECCGVKSYKDYIDLKVPIPPSCYRFENSLKSVYPNEEGCGATLKLAYLKVYRLERWAHWLFICFELWGVLMSVILICKLLVTSRRYNY